MSRRSQRISGTYRNYQSEDNGNNRISGGSSLLSGPQPLFIENSNSRTLRRKPSSVKRISPAPSLGISSTPHTTSYYSESVISESYLTDDKGFSLKTSAAFDEPLESSSYWSEDLSLRRRRGTGGIESSKKINGLGDRKTYDIYGSSSGYSSEDDYTGGSSMDQNISSLGFKSVLSKVGSILWLVLSAPGRFFGLLYWWIGTMWYRLTTTASLLDVFLLTRSYPVLKKILLFMLLLLLLSSVGYGAWYFYPFGLQPPMFPWGTVKLFPSGTKKDHEMGETAIFFEAQQQVLSQLQALERRFETLETAASIEEFQKRKNTEGATLSHENILVLLNELMTQQEAAMREKLHTDIDLHLQQVETRMLEKTAQWQSSTKEGLMNILRKEMDKSKEHLSNLKKELVTLGSDQKALSRQVESLPGQIKEMREDMEIQFPTWFSQFLSRSREDKTGKPFVQHEELQEQLRKLERKILAKILKDQELSVQDVGVTLHKEGITGVTEEQVHHIVNDALKRYSEDRIGMVDYALESGGASVISTRCSETYETKTALLSLFGIPLWYHSQSPRVILQPDVYPGNCWAFQGSQGFAVIRLSSRIHPTAVTLEHISKSLSPRGTIPSAPKDIAVFGLEEEGQQEGVLLGKFTYNQDGDPIQTFHFQDIDREAAFQLMELRVLSNWGHPEYTCIYRFRVHGELVS
ncbi:SUN domain-containing protein 2 [Crotalus adamanteus]|uniref:SUN domain-containing protein 2 n=1 Tax=Crotalus adamanteus TaxID=8729 RepID=A0AAW1BE44_CROAD